MRVHKLLLCVIVSIIILISYNSTLAAVDNFPKQNITVIIPASPGGGCDFVAQAIQPYLEKYAGVSFINVYKPGASCSIGTTYYINNTKADGYTIQSTVTPFMFSAPIMNPEEIKYNLFEDLTPIFNVMTDPGVLAVNADSPFKTFDDFLNYAKENPNKVTVGNSGIGGDDWVSTLFLEEKAGIELIEVPFPGDGPSWQAALGGHISATANNLGILYSQLVDGSLRALAIFSEERSELIPDVPTLKEYGIDLVNGSFRGYSVHKDMPEEIKDYYVDIFTKAVNDPDFIEHAAKIGMNVDALPREEYINVLKKLEEDFRYIYKKLQD